MKLQATQALGVNFYPQCLEKGTRSKRALKIAVAEMYLRGVSTRRVESITQALCRLDFNSMQVSRAAQELDEEFEKFRFRPLECYRYLYLDALYLKVRRDGTVIDQAVLIAYGVNKIWEERNLIRFSI